MWAQHLPESSGAVAHVCRPLAQALAPCSSACHPYHLQCPHHPHLAKRFQPGPEGQTICPQHLGSFVPLRRPTHFEMAYLAPLPSLGPHSPPASPAAVPTFVPDRNPLQSSKPPPPSLPSALSLCLQTVCPQRRRKRRPHVRKVGVAAQEGAERLDGLVRAAQLLRSRKGRGSSGLQ